MTRFSFNLQIYYVMPIVTWQRPVTGVLTILGAGRFVNPQAIITSSDVYRVQYYADVDVIRLSQDLTIGDNIVMNGFTGDLLCGNCALLMFSLKYY
jgi:hypothetical protein